MKFASIGSPVVFTSCQTLRETERREAGFSLLEVLAALAILAAGFAVLFPAFGNAARGSARAEGHVAAHQFAASLIDEQLFGRTVAVGTTKGRQGVYNWTLTIAPTEEGLGPTPPPGGWRLHRVTASVGFGQRQSVVVETLHLGKVQ